MVDEQMEKLIFLRQDLTGRKFGEITVIKNLYTRERPEQTRYICLCSCGNVRVYSAESIYFRFKYKKKTTCDMCDKLSKCNFCVTPCESCSWKSHGEPVEGWTARRHDLKYHEYAFESYFVKECPNFTPPSVGRVMLCEIDADPFFEYRPREADIDDDLCF